MEEPACCYRNTRCASTNTPLSGGEQFIQLLTVITHQSPVRRHRYEICCKLFDRKSEPVVDPKEKDNKNEAVAAAMARMAVAGQKMKVRFPFCGRLFCLSSAVWIRTCCWLEAQSCTWSNCMPLGVATHRQRVTINHVAPLKADAVLEQIVDEQHCRYSSV